jgi:hypothetical protein
MMTLRCTRKLLSRLAITPPEHAEVPTTTLGDWYADLLSTRPKWVVICVNERSLLSVVVPARESASLPIRFRHAALTLFRHLGVPEPKIAAEAGEMERILVGRTVSRSVIGSKNELRFLCSCMLQEMGGGDLDAIAVKLARVPCSAIKNHFPDRAALELFQSDG